MYKVPTNHQKNIGGSRQDKPNHLHSSHVQYTCITSIIGSYEVDGTPICVHQVGSINQVCLLRAGRKSIHLAAQVQKSRYEIQCLDK